jgi:hypothetical protein
LRLRMSLNFLLDSDPNVKHQAGVADRFERWGTKPHAASAPDPAARSWTYNCLPSNG